MGDGASASFPPLRVPYNLFTLVQGIIFLVLSSQAPIQTSFHENNQTDIPT